jgi:hypothetical protein
VRRTVCFCRIPWIIITAAMLWAHKFYHH